jgi:hypothetical protein
MILPSFASNPSTSGNIDVNTAAGQFQSRLTDPSDLSIISIIRGQFIGMILMAASPRKRSQRRGAEHLGYFSLEI